LKGMFSIKQSVWILFVSGMAAGIALLLWSNLILEA